MAKRYFVTGIGTDIGKTIASAVITEKLKSDYWKPIQAGDLAQSDSLKVKDLITNTHSQIHPEIYRLNLPASPHLSAKMDGIQIDLSAITLPATANTLVIEGAGGLMVPLNDQDLIIDLIKKLAVEVIIVSKNYLGSINHTLLTVQMLKQYQLSIKGIIFNGEENSETESYILKYTKLTSLGRIPLLAEVSKSSIYKAGADLYFDKFYASIAPVSTAPALL
jgi:dethiobiotin synthetase